MTLIILSFHSTAQYGCSRIQQPPRAACFVCVLTAVLIPARALAGIKLTPKLSGRRTDPGERQGPWTPTFTTVLPHAEVQPGDLVAAAVPVGELGHSEHVPLHTRDVV